MKPSSPILVSALPACAGLLMAWYVSEGTAHFVALLLIMGIFAVAFDLAYGVAGIFSMGHAAFFGGGAYLFAVVTLLAKLGWVAGLIAAACGGGVLALVFGLLAARTAGLYFALATLAMGQLVSILIEVKLRDWTGGSDGLSGVPRPDFMGYTLASANSYLVFTSAAFFILVFGLGIVRRSAFAQVLMAIRDNPIRAAQLGYSPSKYRLTAYVLSGAVSGIAGALFGSLTMFVSPDFTRWTMSGDILIMTVLGGAGTAAGPLLGVLVFEVAKEVLSKYTPFWYGFLGAMFVLCTLFLRAGIAGLLRGIAQRFTKGISIAPRVERRDQA